MAVRRPAALSVGPRSNWHTDRRALYLASVNTPPVSVVPPRSVALAADRRQDHSRESRTVEGSVETVRKRADQADERSTTASSSAGGSVSSLATRSTASAARKCAPIRRRSKDRARLL